MEPFPMHMRRRLANIVDVAIPNRVVSGTSLFTNTSRNPVPYSKLGTLVTFSEGGTAFIISIREIQVSGILQRFALLLTAAHVVSDIISEESINCRYLCELENNQTRISHFIKRFTGESHDSLESSFTNSKYCVNGDLALVLLELNNGDNVNAYELSSCIVMDEQCCVSGFPKKPSDLCYSIPQIENKDQIVIENIANEVFCRFEGLLYSEGQIKGDSNGIVEISCSTTNGMSGSPIITSNGVVGVYVGGPPVPGQNEVIQILKKISRNDNISSILNDVVKLREFDKFYHLPIFEKVVDFENFRLADIINKVRENIDLTNDERMKYSFIEKNLFIADIILHDCMRCLRVHLYECIYSAVICFKEKEKFIANIGISTKSDIFDSILQRIEAFEKLASVDSIKNILNYLS